MKTTTTTRYMIDDGIVAQKEISGETAIDPVSIDVKILNENAKLPTRGSAAAAGYDLYAATNQEIVIQPHTTEKIPTGLAMSLPEGTFGAIFPRSGIATKRGLRLANCVAVIDSDYRGEWLIPLHNDLDIFQVIAPQERIAQLILMPYIPIGTFNPVDELDDTERGAGGFGSSGTN